MLGKQRFGSRDWFRRIKLRSRGWFGKGNNKKSAGGFIILNIANLGTILVFNY